MKDQGVQRSGRGRVVQKCQHSEASMAGTMAAWLSGQVMRDKGREVTARPQRAVETGQQRRICQNPRALGRRIMGVVGNQEACEKRGLFTSFWLCSDLVSLSQGPCRNWCPKWWFAGPRKILCRARSWFGPCLASCTGNMMGSVSCCVPCRGHIPSHHPLWMTP